MQPTFPNAAKNLTRSLGARVLIPAFEGTVAGVPEYAHIIGRHSKLHDQAPEIVPGRLVSYSTRQRRQPQIGTLSGAEATARPGKPVLDRRSVGVNLKPAIGLFTCNEVPDRQESLGNRIAVTNQGL
jgi:hypothetical protein